MQDNKELEALLAAKRAIVVIESHEEAKVLQMAERFAALNDRTLWCWSVTGGLKRINSNETAFNTSRIEDALRHIEQSAAYGLFCCLFFLLAGCATLTDQPVAISTVVIEPTTSESVASANFQLAGRVSVRDSKQSFSGGVRWHHTHASDEILLLSPLGQTVAQIQRNPEGVQLTTSAQKIYRAADVESLTEQVLGWRLPLTGLQYWVRGVNSPTTSAAADRDGTGRVVAVRQDGWEITYLSFFSPEPAVSVQAARPRVLALQRGELEIRLVVDSWE